MICDIAIVIGKKLGIPVEVVEREHFASLGAFFARYAGHGGAHARAFGWSPPSAACSTISSTARTSRAASAAAT